MFGMSLIKKLCLVGVALLLLLAGVFAWHKGLPPFEGRLNPAVEQDGAEAATSKSNSEPDSAQGESQQHSPGYILDNGAASQTPENTPEQAVAEA